MSITVKYFASLREQLDRAGDTVEYEDGMTISQAWKMANGDTPMPETLMVAVNMRYVKSDDTVLVDGDEIAFFPAVTGG